MLRARWFAVAATTLFSAALGFVVMPISAAESPAVARSTICGDAADLTVLPSPIAPWKGAPLRVMVVAEKPVDGALSLIAPDGSVAATSSDRHGGGPYSWFAETATPAAYVGGRRRTVRKQRLASGTRRRRSAPRCGGTRRRRSAPRCPRNIALGSTSDTGRRTPSGRAYGEITKRFDRSAA